MAARVHVVRPSIAYTSWRDLVHFVPEILRDIHEALGDIRKDIVENWPGVALYIFVCLIAAGLILGTIVYFVDRKDALRTRGVTDSDDDDDDEFGSETDHDHRRGNYTGDCSDSGDSDSEASDTPTDDKRNSLLVRRH